MMLATREAISADWVCRRVDELRALHSDQFQDRMRIRTIMNGGSEGIQAVMAWDSGNERLAQQVGVPPTLKMPVGYRDSERGRRAAEKRERIVEGWDYMGRMHMQYPQIGRWLPGYGFFVWTVTERKDPLSGATYPYAQLRDPYDCYPGWFGADQQPADMAVIRKVPLGFLKRAYPEKDWTGIENKYQMYCSSMAARSRNGGHTIKWEGAATGIEVSEYHCETGTFLSIHDINEVLDFQPNPLQTGPAFVVAKRFSFDRPQSQWHHVVGLMAMMAKLNLLALIAGEDNVFAPIVINGELKGNTWETGRFSVNELEPGSTAQKLRNENHQELFMQIDRLERQLRIGGQYDVGQDAEVRRSGFITGAGQRELQGAMNANVAEYHSVVADANQMVDSKRLEWDERMHKDKKKKVYVLSGGQEFTENYVPSKDINGNYRSRRIYGMMATWDDNSKIVAGLQLLQGGIIDRLTMQENLHGLDDVAQVNDRIHKDRAEEDMYTALQQLAAQNDPRALATLVEISEDPQNRAEILRKFFTPQQPEMSPEEQQMMGGMGLPGGEGLIPEAPPDVQTVLSQMEQGGGVQGGVQTVGRM
jgi:hypothetical protein